MEDDYPEGESDSPAAPEEEREDDGEETGLVSKSFLGGECKVGDRYEIEVVGELEDEAEVKLVKKDAKPEEGPDKSLMSMSGDHLDQMDVE